MGGEEEKKKKNRSVSRSTEKKEGALFLRCFFLFSSSSFSPARFSLRLFILSRMCPRHERKCRRTGSTIFRRLLVPDFRPVFLHVAGCVGRAFRGAFRGSPFRIYTNSYHLFASRMQDARIRLSAVVYAPRIDDSNGHISGKRWNAIERFYLI